MQHIFNIISMHFNGIVIAASVLAATRFNMRGKTGEALQYWERANNTLSLENKELRDKERTNTALIETLRSRTDFHVALKPVISGQETHEHNAEARHVEAMEVFRSVVEAFHNGQRGSA